VYPVDVPPSRAARRQLEDIFGKRGKWMFLARLNASTLILHAFSACDRVYLREK
jgi:hypothetical protein